MTTTFRADIGDGIMAVLDAYVAANPDRLRRAYRARPAAFTDLPCAYIEARPENITHDVGTRTRVMSPSVIVIDRVADNTETSERFDRVVDDLVDAFTATPQLATGTIWSRMTLSDESASLGDYDYAAVRFSFQNISLMDGRS